MLQNVLQTGLILELASYIASRNAIAEIILYPSLSTGRLVKKLVYTILDEGNRFELHHLKA